MTVSMQPRDLQPELTRLIDDIVETATQPRLSLILTLRRCGKTRALVCEAIAYGQRHAGSTQIFACNSHFHCYFMVSTMQNILATMNLSAHFFAFTLQLPNGSSITISLAKDIIIAQAACNVLYLDEFVFLDEVVMQQLCQRMPRTHIIAIATPLLGENILCRNLDDFIGKDRYTIVKVALSCKACQDTDQEDRCVHPT